MDKFTTATVSCNSFVSGIWALPASINLTDAKKLEIKKLISEKERSLKSKFHITFNVEYNDNYLGCMSIDVFINGIMSSIN